MNENRNTKQTKVNRNKEMKTNIKERRRKKKRSNEIKDQRNKLNIGK